MSELKNIIVPKGSLLTVIYSSGTIDVVLDRDMTKYDIINQIGLSGAIGRYGGHRQTFVFPQYIQAIEFPEDTI
jgi:hypothetical protein